MRPNLSETTSSGKGLGLGTGGPISFYRIMMRLLLTKELCAAAAAAAITATLKDKSLVDKIIVKKQPYELRNTNREFFSSFDALNFHKLVNESP